MKQQPQNQKVMITPFKKHHVEKMIDENRALLEASYVLLDENTNEVVVLDGSPADLKFRDAQPGTCLPTGTVTRDSLMYRTYQVSPDLLA